MNATSRRQPIELGDDNRAPVDRRPLQGRLQLRPALERIGALGRLDLGEGLGDLVAFGRAEALDGGLLAFKAETGLALLLGAKRGCRRRSACSCQLYVTTVLRFCKTCRLAREEARIDQLASRRARPGVDCKSWACIL